MARAVGEDDPGTPTFDRPFLRRVAKDHPDRIFRLAKFLRLRTAGYSARQTADLIAWLLSRRSKRLRNLTMNA